MRLVFSRDRPAQLDLLLRSLERYARSGESTNLIWWASAQSFEDGYLAVNREWSIPRYAMTPEIGFDAELRELLCGGDEMVTFFCDDDVVYRPVPTDPRDSLDDERVLTHSWRLGSEALWSWRWPDLPRTGRGYPGSIDGHTFRTADVLRMLDGQAIANPTMLETILAHRCELFVDERPLMSAWPEQVLVGVPVNRVSEQSGCDHGQQYPQTTVELNERVLAGERIALDQLDFTGVDGCHHELAFAWKPRSETVTTRGRL